MAYCWYKDNESQAAWRFCFALLPPIDTKNTCIFIYKLHYKILITLNYGLYTYLTKGDSIDIHINLLTK